MNFTLPMITSILVIICKRYQGIRSTEVYADSQKLDQSNFHNINIFISPSKLFHSTRLLNNVFLYKIK